MTVSKPPHELGFDAGFSGDPEASNPFEPGTSAHSDWRRFHPRGKYIAMTLGTGFVQAVIDGQVTKIRRSEIKK